MKQFLTGLVAISVIVIIGLLAFTLYEKSAKLGQYKREVSGVRTDYTNLQNQFDDYVARSKNLRNIVVSAKTPDSKHLKIADKIYDYAQKTNGDLSIYYKNLTTEETIFIDPDKKYYMASLYKVILTLYLLDKVKSKELTLDEKVGTTSATLEFALDKIITESNNEYAQTLAEQYGWKEIETKMKEKLGIEFSFSEGLEISIKSVGLLFEDIALSIKVSSDETSFLLNLLKDQKKTSKLPKYLPASIYSHNKTGEFEEFSHDAGIFYTPKANYILVFMSKTKMPAETDEQMALMSKEIYGALND
ncbi:MAG: serine hydrolase [Patescibacteria group bacterium]